MKPVLRLGIAGLGGAAAQVLPAIQTLEQIELTAVADVRKEAIESFAQKYRVETFNSLEEMVQSPNVDAVWIATPNLFHSEHTILAAEHGKHIICEKPMAINLEQCQAMIEAVERNGVKYVQGHSKIYEYPIRTMKSIIDSGDLGRLIHLNTWNFNDWLLRPRLASEVDTNQGGGVVFRQGPHQADIIRYLGGGIVKSVKGVTGRHLPSFNTEGNYTAFLEFEDGTPATMVFNGYGLFDITELTWDIGEGGRMVDPTTRYSGITPTGPVRPEEKYASLNTSTPDNHKKFGKNDQSKQPFFGLTIASCEKGVIRQSPTGVYIYTKQGRKEIKCSPQIGRAAELLELYEAIMEKRPSFPDAKWGMASLEVCISILKSSDEGKIVNLSNQVPVPNF
jgi:phthalate 4,5-cis-dihydrodiol dehydrogenase